MQNTKIRSNPALAILTAALMLAASGLASAQPLDTNNANDTDRAFAAQAVQGGVTEVDQARAQMNATTNPSVKLFAQTVIRDHMAANTQIATAAHALNIPSGPPGYSDNAKPMTDRAYMQQEVTAHQQTIALFENEIKNGSNQQLRTAAAQLLPTVKAHLAMAQQYMNTGVVTPETTPTP